MQYTIFFYFQKICQPRVYRNFAHCAMKNIQQLDPKKNIIIQGAQLHNLKNVSVALPRNQLIVITGLSGSGKSSLAFTPFTQRASGGM